MDKVKILTISELYHPYGGAEYATHLILKYRECNITEKRGIRPNKSH